MTWPFNLAARAKVGERADDCSAAKLSVLTGSYAGATAVSVEAYCVERPAMNRAKVRGRGEATALRRVIEPQHWR